MFWELQMNMCDNGNTKASYVCLQLDDNYQVAITGYRLRQDKQREEQRYSHRHGPVIPISCCPQTKAWDKLTIAGHMDSSTCTFLKFPT